MVPLSEVIDAARTQDRPTRTRLRRKMRHGASLALIARQVSLGLS